MDVGCDELSRVVRNASVVTIQPITDETAIRYMMTAVTITNSFTQSIRPATLNPP